jgi:uncharacterized protein (DUF983 family)
MPVLCCPHCHTKLGFSSIFKSLEDMVCEKCEGKYQFKPSGKRSLIGLVCYVLFFMFFLYDYVIKYDFNFLVTAIILYSLVIPFSYTTAVRE